MADFETVQLVKDHSVVLGGAGSTTVVTVTSGDTVYYGTNYQVSSTNNIGSLTVGQSVTLSGQPTWFISNTLSNATQANVPASSLTQRLVDRDLGQPGIYSPTTPGLYTLPLTPGADVAYLARFVPSRNMTIISIALNVSTASNAADVSDVGIYGIGPASTLTLLGNAGSVAGRFGTTGVKNVALSSAVFLAAGTVYYSAVSGPVSFGTAAPVLSGAQTADAISALSLFGANPPNIELTAIVSGSPLPASVAYGSLVSQSITARVALRES